MISLNKYFTLNNLSELYCIEYLFFLSLLFVFISNDANIFHFRSDDEDNVDNNTVQARLL